jgi:hypothetical protein
MITAPGSQTPFEVNEVNTCQYVEKSNICAAMQPRGLTMTIGPSALFFTAAVIRSMAPDADEDDAITDYARQRASQLLEECAISAPCSVSPVSIDQFEHDLLLRWQLNGKGMVLTCPGAPQIAPSLYRERIENGRAVNPEILGNASAVDLARCMRWMLLSE